MADIPKAIQIDDLRAKINFDLQNQAASYEPKDLSDFITYLQRTARNLEQVKQQRQRVAARRTRGGGNTGSNNQRPAENSNSDSNSSAQAQQRPSTSTQNNTSRDCLNCGKKGHFFRQCPEPPQPGRDDRIAAMRQRLEAKNSAAEANRVYELASNTKTTDDDDDFEDEPENE
jgi:hypothetical protein